MSGDAVEFQGLESDLQARNWADARFDATLLIHGDSSVELSRHSRFWKKLGRNGDIAGLAARFEGFSPPSVTIAADDCAGFDSLFRAAGAPGPITLAVSGRQPLPAAMDVRFLEPADAWMTASTTIAGSASRTIEAIGDPGELAAFYRRQGLRFWSESMFANGGSLGIRNSSGTLVCAAGVNFILERQSYGHIGPVATDAAERGKGYAAAVLTALRQSLAERGILACGLLAEGGSLALPDYYGRMGFAVRGSYRFATLA